jgi:hypothetical protein
MFVTGDMGCRFEPLQTKSLQDVAMVSMAPRTHNHSVWAEDSAAVLSLQRHALSLGLSVNL